MKLHCASHSLVDFHAGWCSRTCFVRRPGSSAATAAQFKEPAGAPPAAAATARRTTSSSPGVQGPFTRPSLRTFSHRSAHWEGLRAPPKARAASAPQSRAPAPAASASTTARSVSSSRLVQRPVFAAGTAKPPRGGVTTPAAGRDADPKGSTQGSCPRGCRAAPRGETRARFAGGWSMINGGGLEPAGADFMTLKRGSPRQTQRPSRREANLRACNAMKIRLRRPPRPPRSSGISRGPEGCERCRSIPFQARGQAAALPSWCTTITIVRVIRAP